MAPITTTDVDTDGAEVQRKELSALKAQVEHYKYIAEATKIMGRSEEQWEVEEATNITDQDDDLEETLGDVDLALAEAASLKTCGVSPRLAMLLHIRPWCEEAMAAAVVEDTVIEWQARTGMELDGWTSPTQFPDALLDDAAASRLEAPPVLRRSSAIKFPRTLKLLNGHEPRAAFTDGHGKKYFYDVADAASLPGTSWQWLGGWRLEENATTENGWIYGNCTELFFSAFSPDELDLDAKPMCESDAPLRCRKWRRTRALVRPPSLPPVEDAKANKRNRRLHLVASKCLELRCHGASLTVLGTKLSDRLVATRAALAEAERKLAGLTFLQEDPAKQKSRTFSATTLDTPNPFVDSSGLSELSDNESPDKDNTYAPDLVRL